MTKLESDTIEFFEREASIAHGRACGLMLEGKEEAARVAFEESVRVQLRLRAEKAGKFSPNNTNQP